VTRWRFFPARGMLNWFTVKIELISGCLWSFAISSSFLPRKEQDEKHLATGATKTA